MAREHYETLQQVFDDAYLGLAAQRFRRSLSIGFGGCAYRGESGRRCAIGHCIPDGKYHAGLEGYTPTSASDDHPEGHPIFRDLFPTVDCFDLRELQECHDSARSARSMQKKLCAFAAEKGLTIPNASSAA